MKKQFIEVASIGRCELIENQGSHFVIEDASGCRSRVPADSCLGYITDDGGRIVGAVIPPPDFVAPSLAAVDAALAEIDALADQFTGEDLGAEMAAAERDVNVPVQCLQCLLCAQMNQCIDDNGEASEEVGVCLITIQFRALHFTRICSDFKPLPIEPLRVDGYRVGDAHEGGEG